MPFRKTHCRGANVDCPELDVDNLRIHIDDVWYCHRMVQSVSAPRVKGETRIRRWSKDKGVNASIIQTARLLNGI